MTTEQSVPEEAMPGARSATRNLAVFTLVVVAAAVAWFLFSKYQEATARLDGSVIEQQIKDSNVAIDSVDCPSSPSAADNTTFRCIVTDADDLTYSADVQVTGSDITWVIR